MGRCRCWILGWQRQAEPAKEEKCRMIAYKGFRPGLICRGYQFVMGLNTTEKANCRENGFHCAENPLDCLSYYSSLEHLKNSWARVAVQQPQARNGRNGIARGCPVR